MRRTIYRRRAASKPSLAIALLLLAATFAFLCAHDARGSTRPQMGGSLRVEISEHLTTLDPRQWPADGRLSSAMENVDAIVFDRLTQLDDHGTVRPALAISWESDELSKRWQFHLRTGVTFSDGSPLTPVEAALALQQLLGNSFDVSATPESVIVQTDHQIKDLPALLAGSRYFIFHLDAAGSLSGTGPFRVSEWSDAASADKETPTKVTFVANETCWAGRPFVDRLELTMGANSQQLSNAIAFGQADIVGLSAGQVRAETQRGIRVSSSQPLDLLALQFDSSWASGQDPLVRSAVSKAVDRASMADVILQKQAIPAGGLLPNWVSGYAHLFSLTPDRAAAMTTLSPPTRKVSQATPLTLVYDSEDADARAVAERVAVNLRDVGIAVRPIGALGADVLRAPAEMHLLRIHIAAPNIFVALTNALSSLGEPVDPMASLDTPEEQFAAERAPIDASRVIPLVHVSESVALGQQVRDWMPTRWGSWRLADVWLASSVPTSAPTGAIAR